MHRDALKLLAEELGERYWYSALPTDTMSVPYATGGRVSAEEIEIGREDGASITILTLGGEEWTPGHIAPAVDFIQALRG